MALIIADRIKETTTTTGTGALTLAGAATGFRAFSAVCAVNDTCYYTIDDGAGNWEVGLGTYSGANTLTRTTVLSSSNANAAVSFGAGTKNVWIDAAAAQLSALQSDFLSSLLNAEVSVTGTANLAIGKMHVCSGTTADYTVTLPAVAGNAGKFVAVRMSGSLTKLVTVKGSGTEVIDGLNTRIMWANEVAILYCDGTSWTKVGGKSIAMTGRGSQSGTNQSLSAAVATKVTLSVPQPGNNAAGLFVVASNNMIARRPNVWQINGFINFTTGSSGGAVIAQVNQNGIAAAQLAFSHMSSATNISVSGGTVLVAATGDYFDLIGYDTASTQMSSCWLAVTEVLSW